MPAIVRWFGASEEVVTVGMSFMIPLLVCSFGTCLFMCIGGCLQGEGRTMPFAYMNIAQLVLLGAIVDPLLLVAFKAGVEGAAIATVFSEVVPALVVLGFYFRGWFTVKPTFGQLFQKFSPVSIPAVTHSFSQLIANLAHIAPSIIIRKFIGYAAGDDFNNAIAGYNVMVRVFVLGNSIAIAFTMGYLPAATYALAAKNVKRWLDLSFHCVWVTSAWSVFTIILTWSMPPYLAMMFAEHEGYLNWATPMIRTGNALGFCMSVRYVGAAMLQSLDHAALSTFLGVMAYFVSLLGFAAIFFYSNRHDGLQLIWSYSISYVFGAVMAVGMLVEPVWVRWREVKGAEKKPELAEEIDPTEAEAIQPPIDPDNGL
jgi:Na+-driven multidrug efflux pump